MLPALQASFGFTSFRPGQAEAVQSLLSGRDTLVVMPTGAGKSLIYQLAALQLSGLALVISPLIALMKDQVDSLARIGIPATYINSTLTAADQAERLRQLAQGCYRLVYVAPERLRNRAFMEVLHNQHLGLLAVDEAHCVSEWGHDFRPDYLHIARFREELGGPLTAALTATATPKVQENILSLLGMAAGSCRVVTGFNRPNLSLNVFYTHGLAAKLRALRRLMDDWVAGASGATIIYTGTRRDAEEVADFVQELAQNPAMFYHAGLEPEERARVQESFTCGAANLIVATNAFGMGIDRPDVRQVIHYSLPGSLEAYYQEAGRAGRDGRPAAATLLYDPQDRALQEYLIQNSLVPVDGLRAIYTAIPGGRPAWVTIDDLSLQTGLHPVQVRVALAALETTGAVERLGDEGFRILIHSGRWDPGEIANAAGKGRLHLQNRRARLEGMVAYAESNNCRRQIILDYFGDPGPASARDCCDHCRGQHTISIPVRPLEQMTHAERAALILLDAARRLDPKVGKIKLAQIVHGSRAQDVLQFHHDRSVYYGKLAAVRQKDIEAWIVQLIDLGYFRLTGGEYPVLGLSSKGETALKQRVAIPLMLPAVIRPSTDRITPKVKFSKPLSKQNPQGEIHRIVQLGKSQSAEVVPELITSLESSDGNVRRLAASGLGKIGSKDALLPLMDLLAREQKPQVRQYAVIALGRIGDPRAADLLQKISIDDLEMDYTRTSAIASLRRLRGRGSPAPGRSPALQDATNAEHPVKASIQSLLDKSHPRPLRGPWSAGWSLGFHSSFTGADWARSGVGALVYRLKYKQDFSAIPALLDLALELINAHPELARVETILPVPPSLARKTDPVEAFCLNMADRLGIPVQKLVVKIRQTRPQKELRTLAQKRVNVAGAFALQGDVSGRSLLVVDDLYDSGATLEEITRMLLHKGARQVNVLTLTRTIHTDG